MTTIRLLKKSGHFGLLVAEADTPLAYGDLPLIVRWHGRVFVRSIESQLEYYETEAGLVIEDSWVRTPEGQSK